MQVQEIAPGLWRWTGLHPDWTPEQGGPDGWEQEVGCVYYEAPETLCLIDPLVPPEDAERFWAALDRDVERLGRPVVVLLTVKWHERSAREIVERYSGTLSGGEPLAGVDAIRVAGTGGEPEAVYSIPEHRALVTGDLVLGAEGGGLRLCPASWLPEGVDHAELRARLRPLLDLPVERVLVSHGEPVLEGGHAALRRILAEQP